MLTLGSIRLQSFPEAYLLVDFRLIRRPRTVPHPVGSLREINIGPSTVGLTCAGLVFSLDLDLDFYIAA